MRRLTRPVVALAYGGSAILVLAGSLGVAQGAGAAPAIDNGEPGMLVLEADAAAMADSELEPGDALYWPVATQLEVAQVGELELTIEHAGPLASSAGGLRLRLQQCDEPWQGAVPACASGATLVVDRALSALPSGSRFELGSIGHLDGPYFLTTLSLPESVPLTLQGSSATLALGFTALGDDASVSVPFGGGGLPNTGVDIGAPLLLGSGLVLGGLVFARQRAGVTARRGIHSAVTR